MKYLGFNLSKMRGFASLLAVAYLLKYCVNDEDVTNESWMTLRNGMQVGLPQWTDYFYCKLSLWEELCGWKM